MILRQNEDCTYLYDRAANVLYISLSFEDLTKIEECDDYFKVNISEYHEDDVIQELIDKVLNEEE